MHVGAAQALDVGVLAGGHLDQRRATQEHLGLVLDQDVVVAHPRLIGAAGRGRAEHYRDRRNAQFRQLADLVEQPPALGEVAQLALDGGLGVLVGPAGQVRPG